MGLVAAVTQHAAGMFDGRHLGEFRGLGRVLFVAAAAQVGDVGQLRNVRNRVLGMLRQRAVASFAGHVGMLAGGAGFAFILMAHQAGVLPGERDGMLADHGQGAGPIMPILAEGFGDDGATDYQKEREPGKQNQGGTNEMSGIPEEMAHCRLLFRRGLSNTTTKRPFYI